MKKLQKYLRIVIPVIALLVILLMSSGINALTLFHNNTVGLNHSNGYSPPPANLYPGVENLSSSYLSTLGYNVASTSQSLSHSGYDYYQNATYTGLFNGNEPVTVTLESDLNFSFIGVTPDPYLISYNYSGSVTTNSSNSYHINSGFTEEQPNSNWNYTTQSMKITGSETAYANESDAITLVNNMPKNGTESYFLQFTNSSGTFEAYSNAVTDYSPALAGIPISVNGTSFENLYGPIGSYSLTTVGQKDNVLNVTVTTPSGPSPMVSLHIFADTWNGDYWLLGGYVQWYNTYDIELSVILFVLGVILAYVTSGIATIISWALSIIFGYASILYATNGYDYLYLEVVIYFWDGWWPEFSWAETGWWTNQYLDFYYQPPKWITISWTYIPQWQSSIGRELENIIFPPFQNTHTGVWPPHY